jgi:hypothetical protein
VAARRDRLFRVSSFLELPFVLLAYLTVCRWLDAGVYRRAVRLIWPASAVYTVTFCLIEWVLHNPYTTVEVILALARLLATGPGMTALIGVLGWFLVVFFVPALAIRYGLNFGLPVLGAVAGLAVVAGALVVGVGRAAGKALLTELAVALVAGAAAACLAYVAVGGYSAARVLVAAGAFLVIVISVCLVGDRRLVRTGARNR